MEQRIPEQLWQFLWALAGGIGIGAVYDVLWGLRRELKSVTHGADLLVGGALLVVNLLLLLYPGDGEYRSFFPGGILAGIVLWRITVSRWSRRGSRLFWKLILFIPRCLWKNLKKIIKIMKIFLKNPFSSRIK